ncbi:MAG: porin family protein, partial [Chloroflexi bacterium]
FRVDGAIGYDLNRWVSLEVEVGYFYSSAESLTLASQTEHLDDTEFEGIPMLANVVLHWPNRSDFIPYVRGGAGGVVSMLTVLGDSDDNVVFAYQIGVGVIYNLDERAWIDVGYKFLATADPEFQIGSVSLKASEVRHHFIGGSVTWRF